MIVTHRSGTPHAAAGAQKPEAGDPLTTDTTFRSDERGIALVVTLFMVLILSVLGASLVFVSRTETISSLNYKTMSQTRYGAESGIHHAANHLLWAYVPPGTAAELALYDLTTTPVRVVANGRPVVAWVTTMPRSNVPDTTRA